MAMAEGRSSRQERRAITAAWRRVPMRARLDVLRRAKRGERHPDPSIDAASVRFAELVLEAPSFIYSITFQLVMSLSLLALAFVVQDAFPRWCAGAGGTLCLLLTIYNWDLKRDARTILAVPRGQV
jgi:hypothetical protein